MQIQNFTSRNRTALTLAGCLLFSLIAMAFSSRSFVLKPAQVGLSVFSLAEDGVYQIGDFFRRTVTSVKELGDLRKNYNLLLDRVKQYQGIQNDIVELQQENGTLREVLGFSEQIDYQNVPAQIIGKDPGNLFATITINKGTRDGVRTDMPVVAVQDGVQGLVGKIESVGAHDSVVLPLYDRMSYVAARLQRTRYEGLVRGGGTGTGQDLVTMNWVEKTAARSIQTGDLVITSGMNSLYPKGIHIGMVHTISSRPTDTSLELGITPIVDFGRLEYVFVITAQPVQQNSADSPAGATSTPSTVAPGSGAAPSSAAPSSAAPSSATPPVSTPGQSPAAGQQ